MEDLSERQHTLLITLIDEYVRTATPVASQNLVGKGGLQVSPATIRNELMDLEEAGYLSQPYTSAGRIPTERAWRAYIAEVRQRLNDPSDPPVRQPGAEKLRAVISQHRTDSETLLKDMAKALAEVLDAAVIVGFSPHDVYYTGLTHLFRQPEFLEIGDVLEISALVDQLDEIVARIFDRAGQDIDVLLGQDNPLGDSCSLLITTYELPQAKSRGLMAALGPVRQPYGDHFSLLQTATSLLRSA